MKVNKTMFYLKDSCSYPGKYVYHCSSVQGLKVIRPHKSIYGKDWVFANINPAIAPSFIPKQRDFAVAKVSCNDLFCLVERYEGAFDAYKQAIGSIYRLSSERFLSNQTSWREEVVSTEEVSVIEEIKIEDTYEILKELEREGRIKLYHYPDRPSCIPKDDGDIIEKAVRWINEGHPNVKKTFLKIHPHLQARLEKALTLTEGGPEFS